MTSSHASLFGPLVLEGLAFVVPWVILCIATKTPGSEGPQLRLLVAGCFSAVLGSLLQTPGATFFESHLSLGERCFLYVALTEELARGLFIYWFAIRRPQITRRNAVLSGAMVGLGFALLENVVYAARYRHATTALEFFRVRGIFATPAHATYAAVIAYLAIRFRRDGHGAGLIGGVALAVLLHGTYDYLSLVPMPLAMRDARTVATLSLHAVFLLIFVGLLWRAARLDASDVTTTRPDLV